jgi:hypothetical protein
MSVDSNKQVAFLGFSADSQNSRENINEGGRTSIQVPKRRSSTAGGELSKEKKYETLEMGEEAQRGAHYVNWFREAWPYIQGHHGSTFVLVIPGEVIEKRRMMDCILQVLFSCQGFGDPKP